MASREAGLRVWAEGRPPHHGRHLTLAPTLRGQSISARSAHDAKILLTRLTACAFPASLIQALRTCCCAFSIGSNICDVVSVVHVRALAGIKSCSLTKNWEHACRNLVMHARQSTHKPASQKEEMEMLIYNYHQVFTAAEAVMEPSYDGPDNTCALHPCHLQVQGLACHGHAVVVAGMLVYEALCTKLCIIMTARFDSLLRVIHIHYVYSCGSCVVVPCTCCTAVQTRGS